MASAIARLIEHWKRADVGARPGVAEAEIASFETRHGVRLPQSMAQLYRGVNGVESDNNLLSVWPLREIARVPEVVATFRGTPDYGRITQTLPDAGEYFAFADYMMWSHVYAIRLTAAGNDAPVVWICGAECTELTPTFEALCELYTRDPEAVLFA